MVIVALSAMACSNPSGEIPDAGTGNSDAEERDAGDHDDGSADVERSTVDTDESREPDDHGESFEAIDLLTHDAALWTSFPEPMAALAASTLPTDDSGLIGRNRQWGDMYSARFQLGVGFSLRIFLAGQQATQQGLAFRGIEIAFSTIEEDGLMPSRVPEEISGGGEPGRQDVASAASFFLGDACHGLLALRQTPNSNELIEESRQLYVAEQVARAIRWLETEVEVLQQADAAAPNRLLFSARTFIACGALVEAPDIVDIGDDFIARALVLQREDGVFLEGGGHDTSYQAVALRLGLELLVLRESPELLAAVSSATRWLLGRACGDGRIDSSDNTRTCGGGESFLGQQKELSATDVFFTFAAYSIIFDDATARESANQVVRWFSTNPETSCFEGSDACP